MKKIIKCNTDTRNFRTGKSGKPENCDYRKPYHIAYQIKGNFMLNSKIVMTMNFRGVKTPKRGLFIK